MEKVTMFKIKRGFVSKIMHDYQREFHVVFRNQAQAKNLIEYGIAKFILESNNPSYKDAKGKVTKVATKNN